jgi:hypothetical protein
MSLLNTASPWTSDDLSKKRQPTMRKTFKAKSGNTVSGVDLDSRMDSPSEYVSNEEIYKDSRPNDSMSPTTIEQTQASMDDRNKRVNEMLNKITVSNESANMGTFQPLPNPNIHVKKDETDISMLTVPPPPPTAIKMQKMGNFSANDSAASVYSNYHRSYESKPIFKPTGEQAHKQPVPDNKLLEKINYMIRLLEEQQHEKTNNITEEFILYTFLGVFIIFVVDSFSRSGKYTR